MKFLKFEISYFNRHSTFNTSMGNDQNCCSMCGPKDGVDEAETYKEPEFITYKENSGARVNGMRRYKNAYQR